jgi:hypothetical protein
MQTHILCQEYITKVNKISESYIPKSLSKNICILISPLPKDQQCKLNQIVIQMRQRSISLVSTRSIEPKNQDPIQWFFGGIRITQYQMQKEKMIHEENTEQPDKRLLVPPFSTRRYLKKRSM